MRRIALGVILSFAGLITAAGRCGPAAAADCANDPQSCAAPFTVNGLSLQLYASAPLAEIQPEISRALIIVHGNEGNAEGYFKSALAVAKAAQRGDGTLILAPRFVEQARNMAPPAGSLAWDRGGDWRGGDLSSAAAAPRISSFAVMDRLLATLADKTRFPQLGSIVVAGHSAGGQYVQRYAFLRGTAAAGPVVLRFVVANPSSYLYLDARRPDPAAPGAFRLPTGTACAANRYKYGLERGNDAVEAAVAALGVAGLAERFRRQPVTYLLGESDNDPKHRLLDKGCAAMAQGPTRLARGLAYKLYLDSYYAPHAQRFETVPGVGHNAARMFGSRAGLVALFP
jgi:pimeloyl-ACP methyl ester carboxylesterase